MASTPAPMKKFFGFVDENKETFIDNLAEAVAIKSVSAWPETREVRYALLHENDCENSRFLY